MGDIHRDDYEQKSNLRVHDGQELDSSSPDDDRQQGFIQSHQSDPRSQHVYNDAKLLLVQKPLQSEEIKPVNRELELNYKDLNGNDSSFPKNAITQNPHQEISANLDIGDLRYVINEAMIFTPNYVGSTHSRKDDVGKMDTNMVYRATFSSADVRIKASSINSHLVSPKMQASLMNRFELFRELANTAYTVSNCDSLAGHTVEADAKSVRLRKHRFIRFNP